jgi:drug/metabolite transporter (DMT)-like permease
MGPGSLIGNLSALLSGLSFALFIVLLRKQRSASPAASVFLGNVITAIAGLPFMFDSAPSLSGWIGLLFLGIFQLGLAYVLYTLAISHVTAMEAVLITLIEPVLNPFWVFVLMGEIPSWIALAGGLVIIGAVTARQLAGNRT